MPQPLSATRSPWLMLLGSFLRIPADLASLSRQAISRQMPGTRTLLIEDGDMDGAGSLLTAEGPQGLLGLLDGKRVAAELGEWISLGLDDADGRSDGALVAAAHSPDGQLFLHDCVGQKPRRRSVGSACRDDRSSLGGQIEGDLQGLGRA